MHLAKTKEQKEGLIGTIVFHVLLLLLFIFTGLTYQVPPPETGLTVNFGTSDVGMGDVQPDESGQPTPEKPQPEEQVTPVSSEEQPSESKEDVVTQDMEDALSVPDSKEESKNETSEEKKEEKPEVNENLQKAFEKMGSAQSSGGSEGDDDVPGDKGQTDGVKNGGAYVGGGTGDGNYYLKGRAALSKPKPDYTCQEEGKVVVIIKVDRKGKTVSAKVGKGTTNMAECLTKRAIEAAMRTKWEPDSNAPFEQQGSITYHFILR